MYADVLPFDVPDWSSLAVGPVSTAEGVEFIARHHYARSGGGSATCVGLYRGVELVGVAAFATPVSGDAAASVFGREHQDRVMDLQRFVLVDEAPRNTESWFLVRALRQYKAQRPKTWAVTSYADSGQGHLGTIYQATNALYAGLTDRGVRTQFMDGAGRLRSDRSNGASLSVEEAARRGWLPVVRGKKHRYLFLTPDNRAHRRNLGRLVRWESQPYPQACRISRRGQRVTCLDCHHDADRHGPEFGGCTECRCRNLLADFAESMAQMRRGEGVVLREKPEEPA